MSLKSKIWPKTIVVLSGILILVICQLASLAPLTATAASTVPPTSDSYFMYSNVPSSNNGSASAKPGTLIILGCVAQSGCSWNDKVYPDVYYYSGQNGPTAYFSGTANDAQSTSLTLTVSNICTDPTTGSIGATDDTTQLNINNIANYQSAQANATSSGNGNPAFAPSCNTTQNPEPIKAIANYTGIPLSDNGTIGPVTFTVTPYGGNSTNITSGTASLQPGGTANSASLTASTAALQPYAYTVCAPSIQNDPCQNATPADFVAPVVLTFTGAPVQATINTIVAPTSQSNADPCENSTFPMAWAVCPFAHAMADGANILQGFINEQLNVPVNNYFNESCAPANTPSCNTSTTNYAIWSNMRNLALTLLVIAALVMVIATALDIGPFDAYTVKKMLPKIIIAVIALTFSWQIGKLLVQLSDDLGAGVGNLIYSAAGLSQHTVLDGIGAGIFAWLGITAGAAVGATILGLGTIGPLALLMLLLPLIIGLVMAFLTLVVRRLIIVVCVVFAPIALVAYVMPGGEKLWKIWKDSFVGALFVFPIITALIAMGGILAYLTDNGNTSGGFTTSLIALILFVAPFFLIPKVVKMSAGALGTMSGAFGNVQARLKSGADGKGGYNKFRKNYAAKNRELSKAGGLYSGNNIGSRMMKGLGMNSLGVAIGTGGRGRFGMGSVGKQAMSRNKLVAGEHMMKDAKFVQATYDDDVRLALLSGNERSARAALEQKYAKITNPDDRAKAMAGLDNKLAAAKAVGYSQQTQLGAMNAEFANKGRNFKSVAEMNDMIEKVSASTGVNSHDLYETMSYGFRTQGGRADFAALDGSERKFAVGTHEHAQAVARQTVAGYKKVTTQQFGSGSGTAVDNVAAAFREIGGNELAKWHIDAGQVAQYGTGDAADRANAAVAAQKEHVEPMLSDGMVQIATGPDGQPIWQPLTAADGSTGKDYGPAIRKEARGFSRVPTDKTPPAEDGEDGPRTISLT